MAPSMVLRSVRASLAATLKQLQAAAASLRAARDPQVTQRPRASQPDLDGTIDVPLSLLIDMAVEAWRLDRWLARHGQDQSAAGARFASRRMGECVSKLGLETADLTGQMYEPGLALELVGNLDDPTLPRGTVVIDEMTSPMCLWHGRLVRRGQAVTRSSPTEETLGGEA
jgi:hypothetical protein